MSEADPNHTTRRRVITLSCEDALRDLLKAVEMWEGMIMLPPNMPHAIQMARIALQEAEDARR